MKQEDTLMERLQNVWRSLLAFKGSQKVGADSIQLLNHQTSNTWDVPGDVMVDSSLDSQWTVTFTPDDTSQPAYCEFEHTYQIVSGATAYDPPNYVWDDPSTANSVVKRFVVWRQNPVFGNQTIRMKFGVRSAKKGTITWVRNK